MSAEGPTKTYAITFAPGDEILSGLQDFAAKYNVQSARFTAIGDAKSVKFGWYDKSKKMFKVTSLTGYAEITSLIGDIALKDGKPSVHGHIALATEDGIVHGGHLLEAFVEPTLEVMVTVEPLSLNKKLDRDLASTSSIPTNEPDRLIIFITAKKFREDCSKDRIGINQE